MAINFREIAVRETCLSDIMNGREKVDKKDGVYHVYDFDIIDIGGTNPKTKLPREPYAIVAISDKEFINGGAVLTKIIKAIVDECGGDIEFARAEFRNSGGFDIKLTKGNTANGNNITMVDIL